MITVDVEKEIKQDNKVMLNMNIRQLFTAIVALLLIIFLVGIVKIDMTLMMIPAAFIGGAAYAVGWYKRDGLFIEHIILKRIQTYLYKNDCVPYRTKNRFVTLYNQEYARHKAIDLKDKKIRRAIKKEGRALKKLSREQTIRPVKP